MRACSWMPVVHVLLSWAVLTGTVAAADQGKSAVDPELQKKMYLYEVMRHLYRWYLDEDDIDPIIQKKNISFLIRPLHPDLDPEDRSRFASIGIPDLNVEVTVKRADYTIEELGVVVKSDAYKIIAVKRTQTSIAKPQDSLDINMDYGAMRDHLFATRNQSRFPEGELLTSMRHSVRKKLMEMGREDEIKSAATKPPVVHFAPLSPVANEAWVFVEEARLLIRCASDIDLENPVVWEHDDLAVELYEIDKQTVVSLDEVAGSNAYLTRDQVGRALFNCIILGKRVELEAFKE